MLRIAYSPLSEETEGEVPAFTVVEQDRGNWQRTHHLPNEGITIFSGYNGENTLTFHHSNDEIIGMDLLIVHSVAGGSMKFAQNRVCTHDLERLGEDVLVLLIEVCALDPLIHGHRMPRKVRALDPLLHGTEPANLDIEKSGELLGDGIHSEI